MCSHSSRDPNIYSSVVSLLAYIAGILEKQEVYYKYIMY